MQQKHLSIDHSFLFGIRFCPSYILSKIYICLAKQAIEEHFLLLVSIYPLLMMVLS